MKKAVAYSTVLISLSVPRYINNEEQRRDCDCKEDPNARSYGKKEGRSRLCLSSRVKTFPLRGPETWCHHKGLAWPAAVVNTNESLKMCKQQFLASCYSSGACAAEGPSIQLYYRIIVSN